MNTMPVLTIIMKNIQWNLPEILCNPNIRFSSNIKNLLKFNQIPVYSVLGTAISDHPNLRMEVMSSLRKIISHSITDSKSNYWHVIALYSETCIDRTPSGLKLLFRIDNVKFINSNSIKFSKVLIILTT
jgi:hypothetical protein